MEGVTKSMHCWVLEKSCGPFSLCLHVHSHSLLPVAFHQLHLLWWFFWAGSCPCTVANCDVWGWRDDVGVVVFLLFCPVSFSVVGETWECVLWQWTRTTRRLPYTGCVHLPLVTSDIWAREIQSVRRMSVCCCDPSHQKKSVGPAFQCQHGSRREGSTNTLNEED